MGYGDSKPPGGDAGKQAAPPGERMPLAPPRVDEDESTPPPARPPMSDDTKPPVLRKIPVPRIVKVARTFWVLSFVLGGAAVFIAFLSRDTLIVELTETLGRLAPGYGPAEVESLVNMVYWASIVGLALVITIEAVLLAFILNRRGGARWLQLLVLALHAGVVLVASAFIAIGDWAVVIELLMLAGLALAVVGWVLCIVPQADRWFRLKDEAQLAALD
jgi:hypothetical protein